MRLGEWGEEVAARYLVAEGWEILDRNYRAGRREIDLVAKRGGVVAFVEVKTRRRQQFGDGSEAVDRAKQLSIASVAAAWVHAHNAGGVAFRFDLLVVAPKPGGASRIRHLEDAWRIDTEPTRDLHEGVIFGFSI